MSQLIQTLASYVPNLIIKRFVESPTPLSEPYEARLQAAVFFADISGFTKIAEKLSEHGISGAEELTRLLNDYFGQMISIIASHGGDIVKFAGDALFAIWYTEDDDLEKATLLATQCARHLVASLNNYDVGDNIRLSLRVSIGSGTVLAASVGGVLKRWEFIIAGRPLQQVGRASDIANPGQVVLSPEAKVIIEHRVNGTETEDGFFVVEKVVDSIKQRPLPQLNLGDEAADALRGFVAGAVLSRMDMLGQSGWLAEHRRVSVMFLQVTNLDFNEPDAVRKLQDIMQTMQVTLYHYEGSVRQLIEDDKGTVFIAAFGLPPFMHQDDPLRAVQAAISMNTKLDKMGFKSRIGITTGNVFAGQVGNSLRREYAMVGNTVNLSARLMGATKRHRVSILVDEQTYQAAKYKIRFEELPPIRVKNIAEPVAMYDPVGKAQIESSLRPLIGRYKERNTLTNYLYKVQNGDSNLIYIEGTGGIGKSRLVEDLLEQAEALNVFHIVGQASSFEKTTPYYVWNDVFSKVFDIGVDARTTTRRKSIVSKLLKNKEVVQSLPLLNSVLNIDLPESPLTADMDESMKLRSMRELLLQLLQTAVEKEPTVLVLENGQWMDTPSWEFAYEVSKKVEPLLLVIVSRPIDEGSYPSRDVILSEPNNELIKLPPLSRDETGSLIRVCLGAADVAAVIDDLIYQQARGNPFFSEELAYALREAGTIELVDGVYRLRDSNTSQFRLAVPETLQGVITSRIDRLNADIQLTLKVASVVGEKFSFRLLYDIYPIASYKPDLNRHLAELEALDLIERNLDKSEETYTFKQSLTHDVTYNLIPFMQRRELHEAMARWYERNFVYDLSSYYGTLAHHWEKANDKIQAVKYLERAGEQSLRSGAYQEAIITLKRALKIGVIEQTMGATYRVARWERLVAEAYWGLSDLVNARAHAEKALGWLKHDLPATRQAYRKAIIQQITKQARNRLFPKRHLGSADNVPFASEAAFSYRLLAEVAYFEGETRLGIYSALNAVNSAEAASERHPELARAYANIYAASQRLNRPAIARIYKRLALHTAESMNKPYISAPVMTRMGLYDIIKAQWLSAQGFLEKAATLYDQVGDKRGWNDAQLLLGFISYFKADFWQGADTFDALALNAQKINNADHRVRGLVGYAMHLLALNKTRLAMSQIQQARPLWDSELVLPATRFFGKSFNALVTLRSGQAGRARKDADEALAMLDDAVRRISPLSLFGTLALAEVYLGLWELPEHRTGTAQALAAIKSKTDVFKKSFRAAKPFLLIFEGQYAWTQGKHSRARALWQDALHSAKDVTIPYAAGIAHYRLGLHADAAEERQRHFTTARQLFEPLQADYYLEQTNLYGDKSTGIDQKKSKA
ncbi:MAG: AAA family ATPase [Chloroflexi bacterium]|nr:AAA family ATPase [Chloroflexota bacterium]